MTKPCFDYFGIEIEVGDVVTFPTSGDMSDGKVVKVTPRHITILNISGYKKGKDPRCVINKTKVLKPYKEKYPEDFV